MPRKPKVPCGHPGCPELVDAGVRYCRLHRSKHPEMTRSAASRGYNSAWRKARKEYLEAHPLCVMCLEEGKYTKAEVVDHIIPHRMDMKLFWDRNNWQALCKRHHDLKTLREEVNPAY